MFVCPTALFELLSFNFSNISEIEESFPFFVDVNATCFSYYWAVAAAAAAEFDLAACKGSVTNNLAMD